MKKRVLAVLLLTLMSLMVVFTTGCDDLGALFNREERAEEARGLVRGSWDGNVFTSEFANLQFTAPTGWIISTDEEIAALMGIAAEEMSARGVPVSESMMEIQMIYDMIVSNPITGNGIMLMYENLAMAIGGTRITLEQYLDITRDQLEELGVGATIADEYRTAIIGGEEFLVLDAEIAAWGMAQSYYVRRIDNFIFAIVETSFTGESGAVDNFTRLN